MPMRELITRPGRACGATDPAERGALQPQHATRVATEMELARLVVEAEVVEPFERLRREEHREVAGRSL